MCHNEIDLIWGGGGGGGGGGGVVVVSVCFTMKLT